MIAQKEWFKRRKYGGWGVSPKTWQGWVYMLLVILPFVIIQGLPVWSMEARLLFTLVWLVFLFADIFPLMISLKRDERELKIEALAERNAAWFMSLVLVLGIVYETVVSALAQTFSVNIFIILALLGGAFVKSVSNYILEKESI